MTLELVSWRKVTLPFFLTRYLSVQRLIFLSTQTISSKTNISSHVLHAVTVYQMLRFEDLLVFCYDEHQRPLIMLSYVGFAGLVICGDKARKRG